MWILINEEGGLIEFKKNIVNLKLFSTFGFLNLEIMKLIAAKIFID